MKKYLMFSLEDQQTTDLAEALQNKTCKKILKYLTDVDEVSEGDLSKELIVPANTIHYAIKKLLAARLVEKSKSFFWSVKGKKIAQYKLANQSILISPKSNVLKSVLTTLGITGVLAFFVSFYSRQGVVQTSEVERVVFDSAAGSFKDATAPNSVGTTDIVTNVVSQPLIPSWTWFLIGSLSALAIYLLLQWRKS